MAKQGELGQRNEAEVETEDDRVFEKERSREISGDRLTGKKKARTGRCRLGGKERPRVLF